MYSLRSALDTTTGSFLPAPTSSGGSIAQWWSGASTAERVALGGLAVGLILLLLRK